MYLAKGMPHTANPKTNKMKKGDAPAFYHKADQLCTVWFDKKLVNVLTTIGDCSIKDKRIRCRHSDGGFQNHSQLMTTTSTYMYMGGTDLTDQFFQYIL